MIETQKIGLAISGEAGSGKTTIAKKMGKILNWEVFGAGSKFRSKRLNTMKIGASNGSDAEHNSIDEQMLWMLENHGVAEGRVAGLLVYVNHLVDTYSVLLTADFDLRCERIWERDRKMYKSLDEVREQTLSREEENHRVFSERYGLSYLDSSLYNLTINTGIFNVNDTLDQIVNGMTK